MNHMPIKLYQTVLTLKEQVARLQSEEEKIGVYMEIHRLQSQIPSKYLKSLTFRVAAHQGSLTCFYTGLPCHISFRSPKEDWTASVEHLHPRKFGGKNDFDNLVIAAKFVNNMLGNAPLEVKLDIRDKLQGLKFFPTVSQDKKTEIIKDFVRDELDSYKVDGIPLYPWDWEAVRNPAWKDRLKNRMELIMRLYS